MSNTVLALLFLLCLIGSAYFSAAEMTFTAANRLRLENAAGEGDRRAARALKLIDRFEDTLSAILIGNNLCNVAGDSLATILTVSLLGEKFTPISTLLVTLLVIAFCESVPKILAKRNANRWAPALSTFEYLFTLLLLPVVRLTTLLIRLLTLPFKGERTDEGEEAAAAEIQSLIETVEGEGVIDEDRGDLLRSALDFSEIPVVDVMTARVDVLAADITDSPAVLRERLMDYAASRIPVYEDSIDNVKGILCLNHLFRALLDNPDFTEISSLLLPPLYLYKTTRLPEALRLFRESRQHLAVVTDEFGGMLGIVTLEDVMEQLVGDIWDETDEVETTVVERPDGALELDGSLPVSDLPELLDGAPEPETESVTLGGWTIESIGTFPREGDFFYWREYTVTVLQMAADGRRVERILMEKSRAAGGI